MAEFRSESVLVENCKVEAEPREQIQGNGCKREKQHSAISFSLQMCFHECKTGFVFQGISSQLMAPLSKHSSPKHPVDKEYPDKLKPKKPLSVS